jgi:hypothetical protein
MSLSLDATTAAMTGIIRAFITGNDRESSASLLQIFSIHNVNDHKAQTNCAAIIAATSKPHLSATYFIHFDS